MNTSIETSKMKVRYKMINKINLLNLNTWFWTKLY